MIHTEKTLSQVMEVLRKRGYTIDFNLLEIKTNLKDDDLKNLVIDKVYRFAPGNDAGDESILYAIRNTKDDSKGVFVNGYGIYTDDDATDIIDKIPMIEDDGIDWTKQ